MDKLFIQLSKTGDLCNLLPLALANNPSREKDKVGIMVARDYADLLDGVSYVEKVVFDGEPYDLARAVTEAKKICPNVIVTQCNGPIEEIRKLSYQIADDKWDEMKCWSKENKQSIEIFSTDSFCRESWKLAGQLKEWGAPLIFDRRDKDREASHMPKGWFSPGKKKRIMLVALDSQSSPFPYRDLLMKMLSAEYSKFNIIDLCQIKAHRFYDLLGLLEAAHCLIAVDTAHLHLATAVPNLPVMALIQDRPTHWNGTAWRPQHKFHCRYHDFPKRALELFTAIENIGKQPEGSIHCYHGGVRANNGMDNFAIQPGSCHRDSVNVLRDKERHPMLRDAIRMMIQSATADELILTRGDTSFGPSFATGKVCYAYRMDRKNGHDTFAPCVDMFAAPVEFWVKIFTEVPDVVMGEDGFWSRILMEIFKSHGAVEVGGIYRDLKQ